MTLHEAYKVIVDHEAELLQVGRDLLAQMRADCSAWSCVAYRPRGKIGKDRRDLNALSRMQLAWALQLDFQPNDKALLRFALEEEVKWREEDPWQGIGETLEILAALTAQARDVQDVWLIVRAKRANFDTGCGFDVRHAFAAGVGKTIAFVKSSDHVLRQEALDVFLDEEGEPSYSEEELQRWLESRPEQLPNDLLQRSRIFFDRALAGGRRDIAHFLLDEAIARGPRDPNSLRSYAFDLESLERWADASVLRKEALAAIDDVFDRAGEACKIAQLERMAQNPGEAERFLLFAAKLHTENLSWREIGLGRMFVEECFRTATKLGAERGALLFGVADGLAKETPRLPLVAWEAAVEAADVLNSPHLSHYQQQKAREIKRIERILK